MTRIQRPQDSTAKLELKRNQRYSVSVSGAAYLSRHRGQNADPMPGVIVFYCTNGQDGYATEYRVLKPGETLEFHTPKSAKREDLFLSAFFIDYWPESENQGEYTLAVSERGVDVGRAQRVTSHQGGRHGDVESSFALNLTFAHDPGAGSYEGVIGDPTDAWNLIDVGDRESVGLRLANGTRTDVTAAISENDGEWGISGQSGVFHGYIYHNCQCVDLSITLRYLPPGIYDVYVYAHGDAPDQNAEIEVRSGQVTYSGKSTLNDGRWDFRQPELADGNQYVRYLVEVTTGSPLVITSNREGSAYSMFNAIQLRRHGIDTSDLQPN